MSVRRLIAINALACSTIAASLPAQEAFSVAVMPFRAISPDGRDTVRSLVWYPSTDPARDTTIGPFPMKVAFKGALAPSPGRYHVVVISHGTGGSETGHQDLALGLARAGFVVLTLRHPGDNFLDDSGLGTDIQFYGRSHQVKLALDALLASNPRYDSAGAGFVGFSAGGYTGLTLLGATPDFGLLTAYCVGHPADPLYCADGLRGTVSLTSRYGGRARDTRFVGAVLMAPAFGFLLDSASLGRINTPVLLFRAAADSVVREPDNMTRVARVLPNHTPVKVVPGGHYVFLSPCSPVLASQAREICADAEGIDRAAVHEEVNADAVSFFRDVLSTAH